MTETIIMLVVGVVISIIGYLLMRSVNRIDSDLKESQTGAQESKRIQAEHAAQLKNLERVPERIADHDVRISLIENSFFFNTIH